MRIKLTSVLKIISHGLILTILAGKLLLSGEFGRDEARNGVTARISNVSKQAPQIRSAMGETDHDVCPL